MTTEEYERPERQRRADEAFEKVQAMINKRENMKASELRIGNWVSHGLSTNRDGWYRIEDGESTSDLTQGIYLTEEWLYKCGLLCVNFSRTLFIKFEDPMIQLDFDASAWYASFPNSVLRHRIEYIHELQNLYFARTGEELEIKQG